MQGKKLTWRPSSGENLHISLGTEGGRSSYALSSVWSPDDRTVACFLGRDDGLKVWINGSLVFNEWSHPNISLYTRR